MAGLFLPQYANLDNGLFIICIGYGLVCLFFLFFQLYAFVKVHTNYDEDIEKIKYQVFELEGISLLDVKTDEA